MQSWLQSEMFLSNSVDMMKNLQKRPLYQFKPVHQRRQQALRAYCPNIYTVGEGNDNISKTPSTCMKFHSTFIRIQKVYIFNLVGLGVSTLKKSKLALKKLNFLT